MSLQYRSAQTNRCVGLLHDAAHGDEAMNLAFKANVL
ncbi:MAG: hypothetical protein RL686_376 [Pseudomonadota bacterium]